MIPFSYLRKQSFLRLCFGEVVYLPKVTQVVVSPEFSFNLELLTTEVARSCL